MRRNNVTQQVNGIWRENEKISLFDMGNVLTKYKLSDYIGTYTEDEAQAVLLKNQVCASVEWICMDRGTMTDEEAVCSICKRIPQSEWELVERFVREFRMKQEPNPPMEALLGELKEQGYHLFLMSNTSHRFRAFSKNIPSVGIWTVSGFRVSVDI